jgi:hypothetical protein
LRIVLRDGTLLYRRFVERLGRSIVVARIDTGIHEEIATRLLKVVSIHKEAVRPDESGADNTGTGRARHRRDTRHRVRETCEAKAGTDGT